MPTPTQPQKRELRDRYKTLPPAEALIRDSLRRARVATSSAAHGPALPPAALPAARTLGCDAGGNGAALSEGTSPELRDLHLRINASSREHRPRESSALPFLMLADSPQRNSPKFPRTYSALCLQTSRARGRYQHQRKVKRAPHTLTSAGSRCQHLRDGR